MTSPASCHCNLCVYTCQHSNLKSIMLQEAIYKFKTIGPILLPELIDNFWIGEIKAYEDYAILPYEVHAPQHIEKVIDMFEMNADLAILNHLEPSIDTVFGHECCAYCYPVTERMFKINCKTHVDGLIHELNVTIYNSIEVMSSDLFEDLRLTRSVAHSASSASMCRL